jgi:putative transposase
MSRLLRYFAPGQRCFITCVTENRRPILTNHIYELKNAVRMARRNSRFSPIAWVVLPDHLHALLDCPTGDTSTIVQSIKLSFSLQLHFQNEASGRIWQPRFWDHVIRSAGDFQRHLDYIHYNPVKHGLVESVSEWPYSSFRRFVRFGHLNLDWTTGDNFADDEMFGE